MLAVFVFVLLFLSSKWIATLTAIVDAKSSNYFCFNATICNVSGFSSMISSLIVDFITITIMISFWLCRLNSHEKVNDVYNSSSLCRTLLFMYPFWLMLLIPFSLTIDALIKSKLDVPEDILTIYCVQIVYFGAVFITNLFVCLFVPKRCYSRNEETVQISSSIKENI